MTELIWNGLGERRFEAGVDRGVLYLSNGSGVAWNGLISVTESPSGGDPTPYYIDGVKYLNVAGRKELEGTIEAFTYPDEFLEYDGWVDLDNGLVIDEQKRKPFSLSYRTRIGNDISGHDLGYKLHLIYNIQAAPSESNYTTLGEDPEPLTFSWSFTTTPNTIAVSAVNLAPWSHLVIDSTKTNPTQMRFIEGYLYGTAQREAMLPPLEQLIILFENPLVTLYIQPDPVTGIATLVESETVNGDLRGRFVTGIYVAGDYSRLFETHVNGIYTLER